MTTDRSDRSSAPGSTGGAAGSLTRREVLARIGALGIGLTAGSPLLAACGDDGPAEEPEERAGPAVKPNVLLIVADDMRYDQLPAMPNVRRLIAEQGRSFTQARCNVPLCQPSRVGLFTGQTSKHSGEIGIGSEGSQLRDHDNALGRWVSDAGYRCGLFGKYVNYYDSFGGVDPPAGYEVWRELLVGASDPNQFTVRRERDFATITNTYSTDYLFEEASAFMDGGEPFFCIVTPEQPHVPYQARADLADRWLDVRWEIVDEEDVSDKPSWIQALPPLTDADRATIRRDVIGALQELSAVDLMVRDLLESLAPAVRDNTVVVFTSDNGVHRGEHRRRGAGTKSGPYEVGLHVPLLVRGPGFAPGPPVTAPSLAFQDIAATVLDVTRGRAGLPHQSGISLRELSADADGHAGRILLHEIGQGFESQTGDGMTTGPGSRLGFRKLYRYPSVRTTRTGPFTYEAYDLDTDPDELSNWAADPERRSERDALEAELVALLEA
jgi:arylsulfatase A-like enzyme